MNLLRTLDSIIGLLDKPKRIKDGSYMACCPCHSDTNPSLSVTLVLDTKPRILMNCFGCGANGKAVMEALGLSVASLFDSDIGAGGIPSNYDAFDEYFLLTLIHAVERGETISPDDLGRAKQLIVKMIH